MTKKDALICLLTLVETPEQLAHARSFSIPYLLKKRVLKEKEDGNCTLTEKGERYLKKKFDISFKEV